MKSTKAQREFIKKLDKELERDSEISLVGFGIKQMLEEEKKNYQNNK